MEVLVGAAAAAAAAGPQHGLFFTEEEEEVHNRVGSKKSPGEEEEEDSSSSSSSSSIGQPDDDDDTEDEASSHKESGVLGSLDSLEDALPIKRGLSNHFSGKSKSFANLSEVTSVADNVKEIEKPDHPFNKRRRIFLANKWASASKKSSFYSWHNPKSMPLLALEEDDRGELDEAQEEEDQVIKGRAFSSCSSSSCCSSSSSSSTEKKKQDPQKDKDLLQDKWGGGILAPPRLGEIRVKGSTPFKSQSCLFLTDLQ